jgi:hypothetical protein
MCLGTLLIGAKGWGVAFIKVLKSLRRGSSSGMGLGMMLFSTQRSIIWAAAKKDASN